ncbi:signal peptide peptidase SppA [Treponema sp.]|uniref:signal peptide peptidase SppA n=1 Tax=Treponema sp. TaxID=166 RepID=UPI00298E9AE2|nr:signal peptide peptidase SppA [Treponema sp.]MCR5612826.1 signal peptide peptidase SppA [Treponema sp.]
MNTPQINPQQISQSTPKKTKKSGSGGLVALIIIVILTLGFASFAYLSGDTPSDSANSIVSSSKERIQNFSFSSTKKVNVFENDYIAKLYITGIIQDKNKTYCQEWLLTTIKDLAADPKNKGIILFINSPGGAVYESDEAYLALNEYRKTRKPVWAYQGQLAASGGYYISCGAEYICANRNTLTGSIGVIAGQSIDLTELMSRYGIKSKTFTAGKNKNMLNYNNPLTEEQEKIMQSIADECYDQFTSIVAVNRSLPIDTVKKLADGRIYTAKQALDAKLIDRVCSFDEATNAMKAKYNFVGVDVEEFYYEPKTSWYNLLSESLSKASPLSQSTENRILDLMTQDIKYPAYLYK